MCARMRSPGDEGEKPEMKGWPRRVSVLRGESTNVDNSKELLGFNLRGKQQSVPKLTLPAVMHKGEYEYHKKPWNVLNMTWSQKISPSSIIERAHMVKYWLKSKKKWDKVIC